MKTNGPLTLNMAIVIFYYHVKPLT